jgi:ARC6-like, IMS domain
MDENKQKSSLWKTYGILMGIMLGGSGLILGGQSIWNNIKEGQASQARLETERREKFIKVFDKLIENNSIEITTIDYNRDIEVAKERCRNLSSIKDSSHENSGKTSTTLDQIQATELATVQAYCPENLTKLPKFIQSQLTDLDKVTEKQATALVKRYLEAKKSLFASPFDRNLAAELLTDKAFQDKMKSIDWLIKYDGYYSYENQAIVSVNSFKSDSDKATITLTVTESRTLHQPIGNKRTGETNQSTFYLTQKDGLVKIADISHK